MKLSSHTTIRFCEPDDSAFVWDLYYDGTPRAALLDGRRECMMPLRGEILEILQKSEAARAMLFTIEDEEGRLCGWGGLRGLNPDARFAELFLIFSDESQYASSCGEEALDYLLDRAFAQTQLSRLLATCLNTEKAWRTGLEKKGFTSCGVQREIVFARGDWKDLETMELAASDYFDNTSTLGEGRKS